MGFGDVKLMGALGLFLGMNNTIIVSVLSFLLAAIISIAILASKRKEQMSIYHLDHLLLQVHL